MYVITANVKKKGQSTSQMTNDKDYHMILVIIIVVRGETMLQRALGSGWGVMTVSYTHLDVYKRQTVNRGVTSDSEEEMKLSSKKSRKEY
ncbi:hypothetical protein AZZ68_004334 [Klebsiella pneumoniae]|nr:hypothetical protein AZZ68_004334 [Klebsiella pneumoniae]